MKYIYGIVAFFFLSVSLFAQDPVLPPINGPVPLTVVPSKTEGLELPEEVTVDSSEGFLQVQAKSKGVVKWLVVSQNRVKYVANETNNTLIVSVPQSGTVNIFAVALVDGKLTEFVKTAINVKGEGKVDPVVPDKPPVDNKPKSGLHVTFLFDFNNSNPDLASVLNSKEIRDAITNSKSYFKVYDIASNIVKEKKLDSLLAKTGNTLMVIQSSDGTVLTYNAIPKTEKEVLDIINKVTKGE